MLETELQSSFWGAESEYSADMHFYLSVFSFGNLTTEVIALYPTQIFKISPERLSLLGIGRLSNIRFTL